MKIQVRWQAVYTSTIEVPDGATAQQIKDEIADMPLPEDELSKYEVDTWEVLDVKDMAGKELAQ